MPVSTRLCLPKTPYALRRLRLRAFSDSLPSCRPSSSRCSTRFGSRSTHAPRCTWKSSRSDTSWPSCIEAGDRRRVAPAWLSLVLDVEEPTTPDRPPGRAARRSRADSRHIHRESHLGCAADSRGTTETRDLGESIDRRHVHATAPTSTVANVADIPHQSCQPDHGRRPLRRADDHVPIAVRARDRRA
jgi:hypothetical protein